MVDEINDGMARARVLCDLKRFDDAVSVLTPLIARDPERCEAWCLLAQAQLGTRANSRALETATQAVRVGPDNEWAHRLKSIAHVRSNQYEEGIREAREAVRIAPHSWQCHIQLAQALVKTGDSYAEARATADRARALAPLQAETHVTVAIVASAAGRRDDAESALREALALDPDNSNAHHELARLETNHRSIANAFGLARAASGFADAVRLNPQGEVGRRNLDLVLWRFLRRVFLPIVIAAWLALQLTPPSVATRFMLLALVLIPVGFAAAFLTEVSPPVRTYLWREVVHGSVRLAAALQALAATALVVAAFAPASVWTWLGGGALVLALAGRLIMINATRP